VAFDELSNRLLDEPVERETSSLGLLRVSTAGVLILSNQDGIGRRGKVGSLERWRILAIVGGIIGIASVFTPWLSLSVAGFLNVSFGISPIDFLRIAASSGSASPRSNATSSANPALAPTAWLIFIGGLIVLLGSFIAIFYRLRGGIVILVGAFTGLVGGLVAPFVTTFSGGVVLIGPSWGVGVAFLGGFIVLSGLWVPEPKMQPSPTDELPQQKG
jgi:hypothetical protein